MTCATETPGLQAPPDKLDPGRSVKHLAVEKKKQLDIWRLLPPSLQSEVGAGKLLTEGDRWSDNVDEALEQSEQQVCKHVIFREREEESGGIMFSYIVRHMNRDNTVLQVVRKTDD